MLSYTYKSIKHHPSNSDYYCLEHCTIYIYISCGQVVRQILTGGWHVYYHRANTNGQSCIQSKMLLDKQSMCSSHAVNVRAGGDRAVCYWDPLNLDARSKGNS